MQRHDLLASFAAVRTSLLRFCGLASQACFGVLPCLVMMYHETNLGCKSFSISEDLVEMTGFFKIYIYIFKKIYSVLNITKCISV